MLIGDDGKDLHDMLLKQSEEKVVILNKKNEEDMIISKKDVTLACNIVEKGTSLKESHQFDYLGPIKKSDCPRNEEIHMREAF